MSTAHDLPLGQAPSVDSSLGASPDEPAPSPALSLVPAQLLEPPPLLAATGPPRPPRPLDFDAAVKRLRPRLHRYATRRLGDQHEAEELVQEALLRAYTRREQLLTEDDLAAWSTVVIGRLVIDRLRVRGRSTSFADVPEGARVARDTADLVVARDEARTALDILDAMPVRQSSLLWAREVEGLSYQQLGERFRMTEPAIRSVLTRARKALRKEYALRGGTLPVGGLAVLAPWIAGLTRLDKLRRLAARNSTPATLGALAITALGGLIFSPFGLNQLPDVAFSPAQAVVETTTQPTTTPDAYVHAALAIPPTSLPAAPPMPPPTKPDASRTVSQLINTTCASVAVGQGNSAGAGGRQCAPLSGRPTTTFFSLKLPVALPPNPLGIDTHIRLLSTLPCRDLPALPGTQCTTTDGSTGAQQ